MLISLISCHIRLIIKRLLANDNITLPSLGKSTLHLPVSLTRSQKKGNAYNLLLLLLLRLKLQVIEPKQQQSLGVRVCVY